MNKLIQAIHIQQIKPKIIGLPPFLINLITFVFKPIATIARTIKNLLNSLNGVKNSAEMPAEMETVVMTEAAIKYRMKNGKICFRLTLLPEALSP